MGLFDKSRMYGTPGYGDGIPGNQQIGAPPMPDLSLGGVIPEAPQGGGGLFGRLGKIDWGSTLLGGLADGVAMWGGAKPGYATAMAEQSANAQELKKAKLLAMLKDDDSPYIKDAKAIGLKPGTPEFARWVTRMRSAPRIVANDQGIYNMDTDNYGLWGDGQPASAGPAPGDEQDGYVFQGGDPANPNSWRPK